MERLVEEIFPFLFFFLRKKKIMGEVDKETFASKAGPYENYYQLSSEDLNARILQEHKRSKSMDDKTFKMTLAISFGLTILGSSANLFIKEIPYEALKILIALFSFLSIAYSMTAGFASLGALKTLPLYGYGTQFVSKKDDISALVQALASQEKMNIVRHLRNESAYQSLRNGMITLFVALFIFSISVLVYHATPILSGFRK